VKAISLPLSLKGSVGSGVYFMMKTITLVFTGFTVIPLVSHMGWGIFQCNRIVHLIGM
jgi:hypothetical protein